MNRKVIYFIPVNKKYLSRWEYYQVDLEMLSDLYSEVVVCTSLHEVLNNLRDAQLIYCWWWHRSLHILMLARILGVKSVATGAVHMFDLSGAGDFFTKGILFRFSVKIAMSIADINLFISNDQYHQITSHLNVKNPAVLLSSLPKSANYNVELVSRNRSRNSLNRCCEFPNRFLTVVWHTMEQYRRKGIFETLEAFSYLKNKLGENASFIWTVAGAEGNGVTLLRSKILELGLEHNVVVKIDVTNDERRDLYLNSDLYIQPSWYEGFGNAVLEAGSHGLPALVSRYTAQPEVVGAYGLIAMEIAPIAICAELEKFLAMSVNERKELEIGILHHIDEHFTFQKRLDLFSRLISRNITFLQ